MPRSSDRGGPQTRARIAEIASGLFFERGFDAVTVADVARAAGVSSVTVFNHFPRKEDLFLDRAADAEDLLRSAVRDRPEGTDVLASLRDATLRLVDVRHPLSGVDGRSVPFFCTVAGSPALISRARELAAELQRILAAELEADETYRGDAGLFAAFFIAGYSAVLVDTARRLMGAEAEGVVLTAHRERLESLFAALRGGLADSALE